MFGNDNFQREMNGDRMIVPPEWRSRVDTDWEFSRPGRRARAPPGVRGTHRPIGW
jgi:hypothetical protein